MVAQVRSAPSPCCSSRTCRRALPQSSINLASDGCGYKKTDQERAWNQLPIKASPEVQAFFKASTFTIIGDGRNTLFWEDQWIDGEAIRDIAPCLHQQVPRQTRSRQTVREAVTDRQWVRAITGGLSWTAICEYLNLWDAMHNVVLSD